MAETPPALTQAELDEAQALFRELLRIDTSNPPGNEAPAIDWIADCLRREGIEPTVLESAPGRKNLVARLRGGGDASLLLTGHVDVVPADPARWTADPFAAEERDGWIYGRGAVDMKNHVAASLAVFLNAKRRQLKLSGDLVFAAVADEEAGCRYGMRWLCEEHGELLAADYGLNEIGGFPIYLPGGKRAVPVQTAERGFCWLRMHAHGQPGHGSIPPVDNPVATLAAAVDKLARTPLPYRKTPEAVRFLDGLAKVMGPAGVAVRALKRHGGDFA